MSRSYRDYPHNHGRTLTSQVHKHYIEESEPSWMPIIGGAVAAVVGAIMVYWGLVA